LASVTCSTNDVISSVQKHYAFYLGLGLQLAEIRFRSNTFSSKCSRFIIAHLRWYTLAAVIDSLLT